MFYRCVLFGLLFCSCVSVFAGTQSVRVLNQNIFPLKRGVGGISLDKRIESIEQKIETLVDDRLFDQQLLVVSDDGDSSNIFYGDRLIVAITKKDGADFKSDSLSLANQYREQIKVSVAQLKKLKAPKRIIVSVVYSLVATLLLIFLLLALAQFFLFIAKGFQGPRRKELPSLKIKNFEIVSSERVADFFVTILKGLRLFITLGLLYFYVPVVLSFFPQTSDLAPKLFGYITNPIKKVSQVVVDFVPNFFFIAIIGIVTFYFLRGIRFIFRGIENGMISFSGFYPDWAMPTYKLIRFVVLAFAAVMIFPYLPGANTPAFKGVSVFLGVLLSLGSTSVIANMVGGVVITYMRPYKLGDRVKIAETVGDVFDKNLLVTRVKTVKNVNVTIPNSVILGNHIVNYSTSAQEEGLILHTSVTIGYDVPWEKVHRLLIGAAEQVEGVLDEPKPFVLQTSLDDFYVCYELNAYTSLPSKMSRLYSDIHRNIQDRFQQAGVEILSPHYRAMRDGEDLAIPNGKSI